MGHSVSTFEILFFHGFHVQFWNFQLLLLLSFGNEVSNGMGEAEVSKLITCGAQCSPGSMSSNTVVRAIRPASLCAIAKAETFVKVSP